jgi:hypothetical protein
MRVTYSSVGIAVSAFAENSFPFLIARNRDLMYKGELLEEISVEIVATGGNCLIHRFRPFVALELMNYCKERLQNYLGTKWSLCS